MKVKFNHTELQSDYLSEYYIYNGLVYSTEQISTSPENFELLIHSCSMSELEGSEEGQLGVYIYGSKSEMEEDIKKLTELIPAFDEF